MRSVDLYERLRDGTEVHWYPFLRATWVFFGDEDPEWVTSGGMGVAQRDGEVTDVRLVFDCPPHRRAALGVEGGVEGGVEVELRMEPATRATLPPGLLALSWPERLALRRDGRFILVDVRGYRVTRAALGQHLLPRG